VRASRRGPVSLAGARRQQHAAGGAVQPVRQVHVPADLLAQQVDQVFIGLPDQLRAVHGQPRGLVHRDQVVVLEQDLKHRRRRAPTRPAPARP
jgi:hypothetical protein